MSFITTPAIGAARPAGVPAFEAREISRSWPGVQALKSVSFQGWPGEVIAVCGANGAGKSTFSKILAGLISPSQGQMLLQGQPLPHGTPREGLEAGVLMMYQEPLIIEDLSVEENLWLFDLNRPAFSRRKRRDPTESRALLDKVGLGHLDPAQSARSLTPGTRHMLALARVFNTPHSLLILDETTASTNEEHFEIVTRIVADEKRKGVCVIFVSHKLNEVSVLADRIAVLRDGDLVDVVAAEGRSEEDISAMMIGERLAALAPRAAPFSSTEAPIFELEGFSCGRVADVSFSLRPGEILGLYGLVGSGRSTIGRALGGHFPFRARKIRVRGQDVQIRDPQSAIRAGICYLTEDRHREGFIRHFDNRANLSAVRLPEYAKGGLIMREREFASGQALSQRFAIKGALHEMTANLSGGNQQKVCVAKWADTDASLYIIDEPTKGVDVGAKRQIYQIIEEFAAQGKAVLLISSEAEELMHLAHRAIAVVEYQLAQEFPAGSYAKSELISTALGHELRARRKAGASA